MTWSLTAVSRVANRRGACIEATNDYTSLPNYDRGEVACPDFAVELLSTLIICSCPILTGVFLLMKYRRSGSQEAAPRLTILEGLGKIS